MKLDDCLHVAVQSYWDTRATNQAKQKKSGRLDAGARGEVTGGTQMGALEELFAEILCDAGLKRHEILTRSSLELPGYFRSTKKWDLVVVADGQLVLAMELKSQAGKSIGNNINNRTEEAVGSSKDFWTAFREERFGKAPAPFLGYFFLLEDNSKVKTPVANKEPHFKVDPVFRGEQRSGKIQGQPKFNGISYCERYELFCRRLVLQHLYNASCFITATNASPTHITQPAQDLSFQRFVSALRGHVLAFTDNR